MKIDKAASLFGAGKDKVEILGDIIAPVNVEWEMDLIPGNHDAQVQKQGRDARKHLNSGGERHTKGD